MANEFAGKPPTRHFPFSGCLYPLN